MVGDCRSVLPWHTVARLATAQEETLCTAGQDELCENLNPSQGLDAQRRVCVLGAELKMELA